MAAEALRNVLFIEDDASFADDLLALWGLRARVTRASTGEEALAQLTRGEPDLVLLDLALPHALAEVDAEEGFHLLARMRNDLRWNAPIIVISRDTSSAARSRALALGADAVLGKPIDIARLDAVTDAIWRRGPKP